MSNRIIHLPDPDMDYSLCGDSDDGVLVEGGQPNYNTNGEEVNCPRCLRIIAICTEYAAQPRVQLTSGGRGKNKGRVASATRN